ncbi:hypothetical protein [Paenibacillus sp. OSY-SE]|uniref:hypothetical protein n=1 Tax=Paenibacillus sp. OSY-SE TaxID=1196323 RepID=UPI0012F987F2|nr:hypothetical protein [Paenibacillus sp. OSY-SE]
MLSIGQRMTLGVLNPTQLNEAQLEVCCSQNMNRSRCGSYGFSMKYQFTRTLRNIGPPKFGRYGTGANQYAVRFPKRISSSL